MSIQKQGLLAVVSALAITACGESETPPPPPAPAPVTNAAPSFSSPATTSVEERSDSVFYTATATDADGDAITLSFGGTDAASFTFDSASGELRFTEAADFETPADNDQDNIYDVTITASDGTASTDLDLQVTVTDVTNIPMQTVRIALGVDRPIYATGAGDGSNRLFIVEQRGQIRIVDLANNDTLLTTPFLDIAADLSTGNEQGLLGLAFAPDYETSGLFYVYITNLAGDTEILEYSVSSTDPNIADPTSRRLILTFAQPFANHQAGWIGFGPDAMLYIASGDGGGAGDPGNNAQNIDNLLGAILRIDPTGDDFPADPMANYAVPDGNPFINMAGADEIWAYGLRNPFRSSFDRLTGDFYIGDVGQNELEEIDLIPAGTNGQNFGWNILEGTMTFSAGDTANLTPPIAEYPHENSSNGGFSVTGGYVHRGSVEDLQGRYVFADFVTGNIWSVAVNDIAQGNTLTVAEFDNITAELTPPDLGNIANISSFGEDDNGELYIVEIFRNEVFRIENAE